MAMNPAVRYGDADPPGTQPLFESAEAIVRALALIEYPPDHDTARGAACSLCSSLVPEHTEQCPWRMAREWMGRHAE